LPNLQYSLSQFGTEGSSVCKDVVTR